MVKCRGTGGTAARFTEVSASSSAVSSPQVGPRAPSPAVSALLRWPSVLTVWFGRSQVPVSPVHDASKEWPMAGVVGHEDGEEWVVDWQGYPSYTVEPTASLRPSALGNIATYVGNVRVEDELHTPVLVSS
jgi:hypothetical protein